MIAAALSRKERFGLYKERCIASLSKKASAKNPIMPMVRLK
jgi:hypothetical protein